MPTSRRWKRLFLFGVGTTTLAVILWATYLFTVVWLRVRCVRELAEQAVPLPQISVSDQVQLGGTEGDYGLPFANFLWDIGTRSHGALDRLESLQQPNIARVLRHHTARPTNWSSEREPM